MYRKIISFTLSAVLVFSLFGCSDEKSGPVFKRNRQDKSEADTSSDTFDLEEAIWYRLIEQYHNPVAAASVMSNIFCESSMIPYRIEDDTDPGKDGDYPLSKAYAEHVDSGEIPRDTFCQSGYSGGAFGLFAWTDQGRKEGLYDFAVSRDVSISDWEMQLDYAYEEIIERYYNLYCTLLTSDSLHDCCDYFMGVFEKASSNDANGTSNKRWWYAKQYYDKYAGENYVFTSPFAEYDILPIYDSYDYFKTVSVGEDSKESNIYAYMIQRGLVRIGYIGDGSYVTGYFGSETENAILKMQTEHGLDETGVVGYEEWLILAGDNINCDVESIWTYPEKNNE